ncbi:anillin-like isoform X2 [Pristis pectinata]|uniref:anillin-like isoform X2 n=1 Tax=Pristis pectinata TaxID=685728 RepID=UPI00223DE30C|nr:anillin-like isoform X2 [Pristis pectinata]XP_051884290.1 anillin-like isoform X2 [Pristis pectinata]
MSSLCTVEAMLRSPLKRLRQPPTDNEGNDSDSLKRQKPPSLDEEMENINPLGSCTSSKFRVLEQEVKPDTPIVPSVKSRLRRLAEQKKELCSDDLLSNARLSSDTRNGLVSPAEMTSSWKNELARPPIKKARKNAEGETMSCTEVKTLLTSSSVVVQAVKEKFEDMNHEKQNQGQMGNFLIPEVTPSTKAIQAMLLQKSTPSASRVIWIKKERERELAMLRSKTEGKNPWVEKMSKSCTGSEETPKTNPPVQQEEMKESTELQVNTIHGSDNTAGFENTAKCEEILQITEDKGDCKGEEPMDWSTPLKKVTFALEPQTIPSSEYVESESDEKCISEMELESSSQEELNSSEIIDELFKDVLDTDHANEQMENEPEPKNQTVTELEKSKIEEQSDEVKSENEAKEEDELTLPSITVVSPLAKSIKLDAMAPLASILTSLNTNLAESCCSIYSSLKMENTGQNQNPTGSLSPVVDGTPFYSIDLYRTQRRSARQQERKNKEMNKTNSQGAAEGSCFATKQITTKEKIKILNDEIKSLHNIMHQASQALNCCTDKEHGKGSREEAEAERHLLIASEKRVALLTELNRLKGEGNGGSRGDAAQLTNGLEPCQGTVSISNLCLPLKAEFVSSAQHKEGNPSHYFLLMIKCGPHNIVATPLATAEDAHQGDTIIFPTIITLGDIHYKFEIDVEVYSLAQTSNVTTTEKRRSSRSKVMTPKKLLTSITNCTSQNRSPEGKSSCCILFPFQRTSLQSPGASPVIGSSIRASRFVLVGSHTITLASLGKDKFTLDKVPFLSPLEGAIYLKLQCHFHSSIEHSGFLTVFEDVSGFGAWHRRWFVLSSNTLSYWTYPSEEKHKKPIGCINLADCTTDKIEPASREFCSRPKTLELITARPQSKDDRETLIVQCRNKLCFTKYWLSADTKDERNLWMEKLNQVLINLSTWQQTPHLACKDGI